MNTTLYYFTGTGNSLVIARELRGELDDCKILPIAKVWREDHPISITKKVGFVFPLYYYGLPKIMNDFVDKIELKNSDYIFAVVTRAGDIDGAPLIQLEKILRKKSKTLSAGFYITTPDNFILQPSTTSEEENKLVIDKAKAKAKEIAELIKENRKNLDIEIVEGKKYRFERGNLKFHKNVNDSDELFFADENCNACGTCEEICPVNNIILVDGKPKWQHECQQCLACINYCTEESIQYGKSTIDRKRYRNPEITIKDLII